VVPSKVEDIFDGGKKKLYVFFPWEELDPYPSSVSFFLKRVSSYESCVANAGFIRPGKISLVASPSSSCGEIADLEPGTWEE